jgi:hypothetical protein
MKKKIVFCIIFLVLMSCISLTNAEHSFIQSSSIIQNSTGSSIDVKMRVGLGITVDIVNTNESDLFNVSWSITARGIIWYGNHSSAHVDIPQGQKVTVGLVPLGIGPISITAQATPEQGEPMVVTQEGFLFLLYVLSS